MKIVVNDRLGLLSVDARKKTVSRVNASFAKFGYNVQSVDITVDDVNGPRGGADQECRVLVRLRQLNDVFVTVKDDALSKAVSNAIGRAARTVARHLDRRAIRDGGRHSKFSFEL